MACCVAQRLALSSRCTLPNSSVAQSTEQELGKDKEECPQGPAHPDGRLGSRQEGVCVREDLGGALSPGPHLQRLCPHPWGASELSHILWREVFGKSDSCQDAAASVTNTGKSI